jgi:hypothetical protein
VFNGTDYKPCFRLTVVGKLLSKCYDLMFLPMGKEQMPLTQMKKRGLPFDFCHHLKLYMIRFYISCEDYVIAPEPEYIFLSVKMILKYQNK